MLMIKCIGVFIEGQTLCLAVVSRGLNHLKVLDFFTYEEVFSHPIGDVKSAIEQFLDKNRARKCHAILSLPRADFIVRQMELPLDTGTNLAQIVEYQLISLVPSSEEEIVHGFLAGKPVQEGGRWVITIFLAMKSILQRYLSLCDELSLKVVHIAPSSYALAKFCQMISPSTRKGSILLMQETSGGIEFVRLKQGRMAGSVHYSSAEAGEKSELISKEVDQFRAETAMGEEALLHVYSAGRTDAAALALDPRVALHRMQSPSDWPLRTVAPTALFDKFKEHMPALITACIGLRRFPSVVDLLPEERRKRHSRWTLAPTYALAGILLFILLAMGLHGPLQMRKYSQLLNNEVMGLEPEVRKMRSVEEQMQNLERRTAAINKFRKGNYQLLAALNELSIILPSDSWIMDLSCRNNIFEIYGTSSSATSLPQLIDNSPLFKGSEFVAPVARDSNGREVFRIRMRLEGVDATPSKSNAGGVK
jgi:Tfp pilus assembly protein PilN